MLKGVKRSTKKYKRTLHISDPLIILAALVACTQCEPSDYPDPVYPHDCGIPDCSISSNRYHENALFAHPDPNRYYQCAPYGIYEWRAMERWCICSTVFNPGQSRCTFWWERGWQPVIIIEFYHLIIFIIKILIFCRFANGLHPQHLRKFSICGICQG